MDVESFVEFVAMMCEQELEGRWGRGGKKQPLRHAPATVLACERWRVANVCDNVSHQNRLVFSALLYLF